MGKTCPSCRREWPLEQTTCPIDSTDLSGVLTVAMQATVRALATPHPPMEDRELAPATRVGEYEIERRIAAGGMGTVYAGRHPVIGKRVAIKVLAARLSAHRESVERFIIEAQAVNQIGHPNMVDIFAFGTLPDGRSYLVMEQLVGETLADRLDSGPPTMSVQLMLLDEIAQALEAAHGAGVIHRDLKPDNIFLTRSSGDVRIKLLDFGVAKLTALGSATSTQTGQIIGTPLYMSPEQARGLAVEAGTDVYSLGVVAFEMACGRPPFRDGSPVEILSEHISSPPPRPSALIPGFPPSYESLLLELLAKEASQRPALAEVRRRIAELRSQSRGARDAPLATRDATPPVRPSTPSAFSDEDVAMSYADLLRQIGARRFWPYVIAAVLIAAAIALLAVARWQSAAGW